MLQYLTIVNPITREKIEIISENDGTLNLLKVSSFFPNTNGLTFETRRRRETVESLNGILYPTGGQFWIDTVYFCSFLEGIRETDAVNPNERQDKHIIAVGGLSKITTDEKVVEYFSSLGALRAVHVKINPITKLSQRYAYVAFYEKDICQRVLQSKHIIDGKLCSVVSSVSEVIYTTSGDFCCDFNFVHKDSKFKLPRDQECLPILKKQKHRTRKTSLRQIYQNLCRKLDDDIQCFQDMKCIARNMYQLDRMKEKYEFLLD